jgi:hypothetical protein
MAFLSCIEKEQLTGKVWVGSFHELQKPKSVKQLRLLFLWYKCIAVETGNDVNTIDHYFKDKYLGYEIRAFRGKEVEIPISKANLTSAQMHVYLEAVRLETQQEMNITLPLPEDQNFLDFYEKYGRDG